MQQGTNAHAVLAMAPMSASGTKIHSPISSLEWRRRRFWVLPLLNPLLNLPALATSHTATLQCSFAAPQLASLAECVVRGRPLLSGAALLTLLGAAAQALLPSDAPLQGGSLQRVVFQAPLLLLPDREQNGEWAMPNMASCEMVLIENSVVLRSREGEEHVSAVVSVPVSAEGSCMPGGSLLAGVATGPRAATACAGLHCGAPDGGNGGWLGPQAYDSFHQLSALLQADRGLAPAFLVGACEGGNVWHLFQLACRVERKDTNKLQTAAALG